MGAHSVDITKVSERDITDDWVTKMTVQLGSRASPRGTENDFFNHQMGSLMTVMSVRYIGPWDRTSEQPIESHLLPSSPFLGALFASVLTSHLLNLYHTCYIHINDIAFYKQNGECSRNRILKPVDFKLSLVYGRRLSKRVIKLVNLTDKRGSHY